MRRFLHERSSVLVSSNSFREGFDAPGDRLTVSSFDRLPFGPREDEEMTPQYAASKVGKA